MGLFGKIEDIVQQKVLSRTRKESRPEATLPDRPQQPAPSGVSSHVSRSEGPPGSVEMVQEQTPSSFDTPIQSDENLERQRSFAGTGNIEDWVFGQPDTGTRGSMDIGSRGASDQQSTFDDFSEGREPYSKDQVDTETPRGQPKQQRYYRTQRAYSIGMHDDHQKPGMLGETIMGNCPAANRL